MNYYNEFDPFAAAWLRNLIAMGVIPKGDVDERDMREVEPSDLVGYTQCHFFAGIGGWAYALRLADWPDDRPVWTGSPPCQPFSAAGKQLGVNDERHLAPHFLELVQAVRPPVLFGEQVATAVKKDTWLDDLLDALEREDYATGAVVLPACGIGAPHIRQRLWFVGQRMGDGIGQDAIGPTAETGGPCRMANIHGGRCGKLGSAMGQGEVRHPDGSVNTSGRMADTEHREQRERGIPGRQDQAWNESRVEPGGCSSPGGVDYATSARCDRSKQIAKEETWDETWIRVPRQGCGENHTHAPPPGWDDPDWLYCRDGKWRPVEPGTFPLAHGIPNRVGLLRGYGNAIVPELAAEVIKAYMDQC